MVMQSSGGRESAVSLKEPGGWFAAGGSFRQAMTILSDGAFKLFVHLCLEADRRTGRVEATHKELAAALRKSKRSLATYGAELDRSKICKVSPGKNQFAPTGWEISDPYWPYHRTDSCRQQPEEKAYVQSVRECFLTLGCASGKFGAADVQTARELQQRALPLAVIQDALFLGACRKYSSWLEGQALEPIRSLRYFEPLIAEIQEKPFPPGYSAYLRRKITQLARSWSESTKPSHQPLKGGYPDRASTEIMR